MVNNYHPCYRTYERNPQKKHTHLDIGFGHLYENEQKSNTMRKIISILHEILYGNTEDHPSLYPNLWNLWYYDF